MNEKGACLKNIQLLCGPNYTKIKFVSDSNFSQALQKNVKASHWYVWNRGSGAKWSLRTNQNSKQNSTPILLHVDLATKYFATQCKDLPRPNSVFVFFDWVLAKVVSIWAHRGRRGAFPAGWPVSLQDFCHVIVMWVLCDRTGIFATSVMNCS